MCSALPSTSIQAGSSVALYVAVICGSLSPVGRTLEPQATLGCCQIGARAQETDIYPVTPGHAGGGFTHLSSCLSVPKASPSPNSLFTHFSLPASVSHSVKQTGLTSSAQLADDTGSGPS